jgi:nicotinate-nucleotide adenylyltransferase
VKFAVLGGSFNPVHLGHLILAETVLTVLGYDRVILVPAFTSPFKPGVRDTEPQDRLDMLTASVVADPRLAVDDCEVKREGISYTINTIEDLERRYQPEGKLGLILGDDLLEGFPRWRRADELAAKTDIIIARRLSSGPLSFPYPFKRLDNDIFLIASQDIRTRIQNGLTWRYLVPEGARFIIQDRRLYGCVPGGHGLGKLAGISDAARGPVWGKGEIAAIEAAVRVMVSPSRFLHSRGVAALAWEFCAKYGLDPDRGYLAGIAHDIAKSLSEGEHKRLAKKDGKPISKLEQKKPSLLHPRSGAILLRERFGITDEEILSAVRNHTSGSPEMGPLAKIVYMADKIEPTRTRVKPELRNPEKYPSLDGHFAAVLDETVAYLRSQKLDLSEGTERLLEAMRKRRDS